MVATAPNAGTTDAVVTGEAVLVELPVAGPAVRLLSGGIDVVLAVIILVILFFAAAPLLEGLDEAAGMASILVLSLGVLIGLPTVCETLTRGRTLGKKILGLRSVRDDGGPIDFRRALTRNLIGFVEIYLLSGIPALICALVTSPTRRLGDIGAGTYVAHERVDLVLPEPVQMPAQLAQWAAGADIGPLPDPLVAQMRAALRQGEQFTPETTRRLAETLAHDVRDYVLPHPPSETPPLDLIKAVLAERRRRAGLRLAEQARARERLFGVGNRG
ncbi:RDD family protein [Gephyromycinifex aptenodytis]|uniref:RDD family protein n=1 Tax=Gephyromycinifex aptenodytis TaxID=2716227 RepID=UPI00144846E5|nr:RDD family protein [Gephyromycinifex aptenodytis]